MPYFEDGSQNGAELFDRVRLSLTVDQNHWDFIVYKRSECLISKQKIPLSSKLGQAIFPFYIQPIIKEYSPWFFLTFQIYISIWDTLYHGYYFMVKACNKFFTLPFLPASVLCEKKQFISHSILLHHMREFKRNH